MGFTNSDTLINTAQEQSENGIITTTLGFRNGFNEDLLIGMADASGGNFYYIQSPEDALDVFRIEMESLVSVVAQNVILTLQPETGVNIDQILNNYRTVSDGETLKVLMGDVYGTEKKQTAIAVSLPAYSQVGETPLLSVSYEYQAITNQTIETFNDLVKPGEEQAAKLSPRKTKTLKSAKVQGTLADLETTDTVGDGVLVQCLKDGKKLRVRVVSDAYNPDWNMRFPRSIREEGVMYVVDGVKEAANRSYIALGQIKKFVQK